jgi:hypothetical protein
MNGRKNRENRGERVRASLPIDFGSGRGLTRDVSASGIFFETDAAFSVGNSVDFTVEFAAAARRIHMRCRGEIVRVESHGSRLGVAVRIVESRMGFA